MLAVYVPSGPGLARADTGPASLADEGGRVELPPGALWLDLFRPLPRQVAAVEALGVAVPTLADMQEIEISSRLHRKDGLEYLTVVLPGSAADGSNVSGPVTFILGAERLVTVRHHAPQPFETFPQRADMAAAGCAGPSEIFMGLIEEIVSRLADILEEASGTLDIEARRVFAEHGAQDPAELRRTIARAGQEGERIGRVRLALLTLERALTFFGAVPRPDALRVLLKGLMRDILALTEHCDFLSARIGLTVDATLGMINLVQNATIRIVSVAAVLFLPPTLVASIYGMNFAAMPELEHPWGYPAALVLMVVSAVVCFLVFKWKKWL